MSAFEFASERCVLFPAFQNLTKVASRAGGRNLIKRSRSIHPLLGKAKRSSLTIQIDSQKSTNT